MRTAAALPALTRRRLAGSWAYRARLEMEAARRFERLAARLLAIGAPARLGARAARAAHDERLHVLLCADLAASFAPVSLPDEAPEPDEIAPPGLDARDRVLYEVVAFCCVTETVNSSLVVDSLAHAKDPRVRPAVRRILADEIAHARVGWGFLAVRPPDERQAAWIGAYLPDMLAGTVRETMFAPAEPTGDEQARALCGQLPVAERLAAFVTAMRRVLFPGLAAFGVDTGPGEAWLASRLISV